VLLYVTQCAVGYWAQRTPAQHRTRVQRIALAGLGACIVLLAFYDAWLGVVAADDSPLLWSILFVVSRTCRNLNLAGRIAESLGRAQVIPPLYLLVVLVIQRRYGSTQEDAKGEYVALDTRAPNEEVENGHGEGHIAATDARL
jgi:hypothetical protein